MGETRLSVVIATRDGEETLPITLDSLLEQDIPIFIAVGDDCSLDSTPEILEEYYTPGKLEYKRLSNREPKSYGRPPILYNLANTLTPPSEYYMISGDDTKYSRSYCRKVIEKIEDTNIGIASGKSIEHMGWIGSPGGSGRIFKAELWDKLTPFPHSIGWETGAQYKAMKMGYDWAIFPIYKSHLRPQRLMSTWSFGHAAHTLNVPIMCTLYRVISDITKGTHPPLQALSILLGQMEYSLRGAPQLNDIAEYVNYRQKIKFLNNIKGLFFRPILNFISRLRER